jgi:ComF family protein
MNKFFRRVLDAVYTRPCVLCGKAVKVSNEINLCSSCDEKIDRLGRTIGTVSHVTISALPYIGHVRKAMGRFKFRSKKYYGFTFANLICRRLSKFEWSKDIDCVLCAPMLGRDRIYNQSAVIAEHIAENLDIPFSETALVKVKNNPPFYKLKRPQRLKYIKNAFRVNEPDFIDGKCVLLVDDIYTTGITVGECARTLVLGGAARVYCATACYPVSVTPDK